MNISRSSSHANTVRKHPAPEGVLKPLVCADGVVRHAASDSSQQNTSRREIGYSQHPQQWIRKRPAPEDALKHVAVVCSGPHVQPESTQHRDIHKSTTIHVRRVELNVRTHPTPEGNQDTLLLVSLCSPVEGVRNFVGPIAEAESVDSHGWDRRSFGLTSLEVGG